VNRLVTKDKKPIIIASSGSLSHDGLGWEGPERLMAKRNIIPINEFDYRVGKTITLEKIPGSTLEIAKRVRLIWFGAINAVALKNLGARWFVDTILPNLGESANTFMPSLHGTPLELATMTKMIESSGADIGGYQINYSCPNVGNNPKTADLLIRSFCEVADRTNKPVSVKFSVVFDRKMVEPFYRALEDQVLFTEINSIPFALVYPGKKSPLAKYGGGAVSGRPAQEMNWRYAKFLSNFTSGSIIWPGIWSSGDAFRALEGGAHGLSMASVFMQMPWRPRFIIRDIKRQLSRLEH